MSQINFITINFVNRKRPHARFDPCVWSFLINPLRGGLFCVGTIVTYTNTKGKPTNSEFIALIADKLQLQLKSAKVVNF